MLKLYKNIWLSGFGPRVLVCSLLVLTVERLGTLLCFQATKLCGFHMGLSLQRKTCFGLAAQMQSGGSCWLPLVSRDGVRPTHVCLDSRVVLVPAPTPMEEYDVKLKHA